MAVQWHDFVLQPAPPLSRARLNEIQEQLGVTFPEAYLKVIQVHQGAAPDKPMVHLPDGRRAGVSLNMLLHFEAQPEGMDVLGIVDWSEVLPDKLIPFGMDPGDSYFCFDYRATSADPPVVLLATDELHAVPQFVANSFTELIESLR